MLLKQTTRYLPAQIIAPLTQVAAAVTWTHWLAPAPYGLLTFILAGQELVFLATLSWWTHFTMRYLGGFDPAAGRDFVASEAPVLAFAGVAQAAGTLIVLAMLGAAPSPSLAAAAIAYVCSRTLLQYLGERARVQTRIAIYTLGQVFGSLVGFVLALAIVTRVAATTEAILLAFSVAQAIAAIAMWRGLGLSVAGLLPRRSILEDASRYGLPLLVAGGFTWLAQNGIRLIVDHGAGAAALGLLSVGWGLGQRLAATLAMLVVAASFPLAVASLHAGSRDDAFRQIKAGGLLLAALVMPASIGICFLAAPFASLAIAEPFRAATIAILPAAAAAGAVRNLRMHVADPVFLLVERTEANVAINVVDALLMVAGCGIGLAMGGLLGAVVGALVATCVSTVVGFLMAARIAGFEFPLGDASRLVAASAAMAAVLATVPWDRLAEGAIWRMTAEIATGVFVYAIALVALYPHLARRAYRVGIGVPLR